MNICDIMISVRKVNSMRLFPRIKNKYAVIFEASNLSAEIVNNHGQVVYATENAPHTTEEERALSTQAPYMRTPNHRLMSKKIFGGYVYWIEDLSEVNRLSLKLKDEMENLSGSNQLLSEEITLKHRNAAASAKNDLYDKIASGLEEKIEKLEETLKDANEASPDLDDKIAISAVDTAFVKRYSNLMLIGESNAFLPITELEYCLKESLDCIALAGAKTSLSFEGYGELTLDTMLAAYEDFESLVEDGRTRFEPLLSDTVIDINMHCDGEVLKINQSIKSNDDILETHYLYRCARIIYSKVGDSI